ncbi:MAG TPA: FKBP-type peptidyl-prolyl cis-trans isomerase [Desulfuromonadales bacterium]|nr:FKBP-type peptidyl-prolyl cis-trans isomerase [Desulfuromonadales bacterium]
MKRRLMASVGTLGILLLLASVCTAATTNTNLKDLKDRVSYSIGMNIGRDFMKQGVDINPDLVARGIKDVLSGGKLLMSKEDVKKTLTEFRTQMKAKHEAQVKELAAKNKKEGEAFLAKNKKEKGVVTLADGLQYKIIKKGTGPSPTKDDTVTVNYRGTLVNGTEFDSSYKRGKPATFPVSGVIRGWTEALPLMKEGAKWRIFIPASLAYGEHGAGNVIGPNAVLIFDVDLLKVHKKGEHGKAK